MSPLRSLDNFGRADRSQSIALLSRPGTLKHPMCAPPPISPRVQWALQLEAHAPPMLADEIHDSLGPGITQARRTRFSGSIRRYERGGRPTRALGASGAQTNVRTLRRDILTLSPINTPSPIGRPCSTISTARQPIACWRDPVVGTPFVAWVRVVSKRADRGSTLDSGIPLVLYRAFSFPSTFEGLNPFTGHGDYNLAAGGSPHVLWRG
ncbi:hypothetical protein PHLGIDRAFT_235784 [Phlebiopsis gigantea 11061_1 CR5-6]|uniref:Uncharacterized protein n=1 Tax=Phlebiopsis gigantea (strain 11061_1 CR5-6) TaxID=745531 RepID=A0A0C3PDU1_PHLG1|nr:hypothetical protein PHLGIDRAFT_235784 [Phlebiopsis gigantea 11061_1 CR5-6]